jgi:hypothetical protein
MKRVSRICLTIIVLSLAGSATIAVGDWGIGAGAQDGDVGFQVREDFWLGGDISRLTCQAPVYSHSKTTFAIDADDHFIINPDKPSRFYPLVGFEFAFNSDHSEVGINGGGGMNSMLTRKTAAFVEAKYVFGEWDGWAVTVGFSF